MTQPLRFRADGTFTIVQFTDIHIHNDEPADEQTSALMAAVLDAEQPDLVLLTGDVIDGSYCTDPAASWRRAVAPIVSRGLPWAAVYGNHDDEGSLTRRDLMAVQQALPGCLSEPGPAEVSGVGNYVLAVQPSHGNGAAALLYCLDSHAYAETAIGGYDWVRRDQIAWYLTTATQLRAAHDGSPRPGLAFFHIPLPEYKEVWNQHICRGHCFEPIASPLINSGFFAALHEAGDVAGVFVGHDHVNDFDGSLYGIRLCYGRGSGYNTYGREGFPRGARVIRLQEGESGFTSWLRLEGGEVVTEQPEHDPSHHIDDRA